MGEWERAGYEAAWVREEPMGSSDGAEAGREAREGERGKREKERLRSKFTRSRSVNTASMRRCLQLDAFSVSEARKTAVSD